ncbi:hypothetical protein MNBD_NITROSPINAE02-1499 [hydrothermal vent metagenome]|uniref:Ferrous iron transport permease EfeU n=1 Tax=hydrothermal vent metagenome TaxID=652676 RepID=A0A3B1D0B8_9ZZZZ
MTGGFLVTFREGLEAFLVIGIILSHLTRTGFREFNKWIFVGASLGLVSAFLLAFLFQFVFTGFESEIGAIHLKIGIMTFAIIVLTYMTLWMSHNAHHLKDNLRKRLTHVMSTGSVFALVLMSYLAILREGFETALFLGAVYGDEMGTDVLYGGILGLVFALVFTYSVFTGMKALPLKFFFRITGGLILLISAGLLSNMVGMLQDVHLAPIVMSGFLDLRWILDDSSSVGIFFKAMFGYTSNPNLLQIVAYWGYIISIIFFLTRENLAPPEEV